MKSSRPGPPRPASFAAVGPTSFSWVGRVDDLPTPFVPLQPLENDGTTDHVPPESCGFVASLDPHRTVHGETTVRPLQHRVDGLRGDLASHQQQAKHLGSEEPLKDLLTLGQMPVVIVWAAAEGSWALDAGYWVPGLASAALNVAANLAYLRSVQLSPLSATIPLLALGQVFTTLVAVLLLGQIPTLVQAAGIVTVVLGALVLNHRAGDSTLVRGVMREPGGPLMMAVALLWALTLPLDKLAIDHSSPAMHSFVLTVLVGLAALGLVGREMVWRLPRGSWMPLVAAIVIGTTALVLQMLAIQFVMVGLVETFKRGFGCLAAVVLGRWVLGEPVTPQKAVSVLLMGAGVALVLLSR